ncbi:MAG: hypothetical protein ICV55_14390 [Coleofasciculus sp. C3-bin4]|nr:hypothetical protein [Coleofasciculus sp. C3-bin4]
MADTAKQVNQPTSLWTETVSAVERKRTPRPRRIEDTLPYRISTEGNVETPMRSVVLATVGTAARQAQTLSGHRMPQEANASRRKARGNRTLPDNSLDRAHAQVERLLT